jgi:arylsulfatase A-like enzyme
MLIIIFALLCGLIGEGLEIGRLRASGLSMPGLGLCATLFVAYAAVGVAAALVGAVAGARRWRLAAALFSIAVVVPWANFELLPAAGSVRSVVGSVATAILAGAAGWWLALVPRLSALIVLLLGVAVNVPLPGRLAAPSPTSPGGPAVAGRPNLVVILIDTLRADHLGIYGYDRPTSPRIDAFAREGVRFERAVAQAPWTKPSIASLFTGRYVHRHGVIRSLDALDPSLPTLASVLADAGYRTAAFSANPWITPEFRFDRGFGEFESGRAMGPQLTNLYRTVRRIESLLKQAGAPVPIGHWVFRWAGRENASNTARDEAQTRSVVEWLGTAEGEAPFFLYVHMIGPHDPYDPPEAFARVFARSPSEAPRLPPARVQTVFEKAEAMDAESKTRLIDQYDAAIAHADSLVGRILDELDNRGLAETTAVIVTSDHGEEFYEHGNWRHGNQLYDEVVRVPLLIRGPGAGRGEVRRDPAMLIDVLPTALALVGVTPPSSLGEIEGRALLPESAEVAPSTFTEHWWFQGGTYVAQAVERSGLKLQSARDRGRDRAGEELYDLRQDAGEQVNLLANGSFAAPELAELRALMAMLGSDEIQVSREALDEIDPQTRERLRNLGYLDDAAGD